MTSPKPPEGQPADPSDLLSAVGGTPLFRLKRLTSPLPRGVEVHVKAEHLNLGGSVKDRPVLSMLLEGERTGRLGRGRTILDATSGNSGIAYATLGAALGYEVTLCLPANASAERKAILRALGAQVLETDPLLGVEGAQTLAQKLALEDPQRYFYPDQFNNDANWRAHYRTTAEEIFRQTDGRITHFITGAGTSGTFVGNSRRLKELNPEIRTLLVQPDGPLHGLEGMKHLATVTVPGIFDPSLVDGQIEVATEDAWETARRLAREEGLFVGVSSGANVRAALQLAAELPAEAVVVTILADSGTRYLSDGFWDQTE